MNILNESMIQRPNRPIKVVQFGEGNFLRAFVDWMLQELNNAGLFNGDIAVVQPLEFGRVKELEKQDGLYTLIQEGVQNNEFISKSQIIDSLKMFVNPYESYEDYLKLAEIDTLELLISNTTESGIVLDENDSIDATPPKTFPGKVLAFLYHRYQIFNGDPSKGLYIVPCELIDNNGDELYRCVKALAKIHGLSKDFMTWLDEANTFTNTLVDRIVPGYPATRIEELTNQLGYIDHNLVLGEVFHLWVIEDRNGISEVLNGAEAGLNILFVKDIKPYKIRKVRILNGLHTLMVPVAYLSGIDTVGETMADKTLLKYLHQTVEHEMVPATEKYLTSEELHQFAKEVYDRFNNPRVRHELMSIALNSSAKFKSRLLPTALDYVERFGQFPKNMAFSLASAFVFYRGIRGNDPIALQDEPELLNYYHELWSKYESNEMSLEEIVSAFLGMKNHWGLDLNAIPQLTKEIVSMTSSILSHGMKEALTDMVVGA